MTEVRQNLIVFGCGPKGSGKTRFLHEMFARRTPRLITLDVVGEAGELDPECIQAAGMQELRRALAYCARAGRRWHVAAALDREELPALFRVLAPPFASGRTSFARSVGGVALQCSEIDDVAPASGADPEIIAAWRRGRHHCLSIYAATQRPASCARDVSAQADVLFSFATHEPRDLEYLARATSKPVAALVAELPRYHAMYYHRQASRVFLTDQSQRAYRVLSLAGAPITT